MAANVPTLETRRLLLRPIELADAAQAQALFPRWEIVQYMNPHVPWPYPPDGALTFFRDVAIPAMERGDAWHWSLRERGAPDQLVGCISLMRGERENRGFWVGQPWQGRGYAAEACEAVVGYWFEVLGFEVLRVAKAVTNEASRRISVSEGMRVVATEERDFVSGRHLAETWELTRAEWRAMRAAAP